MPQDKRSFLYSIHPQHWFLLMDSLVLLLSNPRSTPSVFLLPPLFRIHIHIGCRNTLGGGIRTAFNAAHAKGDA